MVNGYFERSEKSVIRKYPYKTRNYKISPCDRNNVKHLCRAPLNISIYCFYQSPITKLPSPVSLPRQAVSRGLPRTTIRGRGVYMLSAGSRLKKLPSPIGSRAGDEGLMVTMTSHSLTRRYAAASPGGRGKKTSSCTLRVHIAKPFFA